MELTFDHLSMSLGGRPVLRDVSAVLRPGRVTVILGPNGAGKSTLLRAAVGLHRPDAGSVVLAGRNVASLDPRERARTIGYLPQDGDVQWNVTVAQVVALGRLPHHAPFAGPSFEDRQAIARAVEATEIAPFLDRRVHELSGGERARVLLARVLAGDPRWLFADEPLASLDPAHQLDMLDRLRARAAAGAGVVVVLHDLVQAGRIADDVLILKEGRVVAAGEASAVMTAGTLSDVFGIAVTETSDAAGRSLFIPGGRGSIM